MHTRIRLYPNEAKEVAIQWFPRGNKRVRRQYVSEYSLQLPTYRQTWMRYASYYQVTGDMIDMFPLVGMGVNIPGLLIGLFFIDKYGIKVRLLRDRQFQSILHANPRLE